MLYLFSLDLSQESISQFFMQLMRSWSAPRNDCPFPVSAMLSPCDICCTLPFPLPRLSYEVNIPILDVDVPLTTKKNYWVWPWMGTACSCEVSCRRIDVRKFFGEGSNQPATTTRYVPPLCHIDISSNSLGAKGAALLRAFFSVSVSGLIMIWFKEWFFLL